MYADHMRVLLVYESGYRRNIDEVLDKTAVIQPRIDPSELLAE